MIALRADSDRTGIGTMIRAFIILVASLPLPVLAGDPAPAEDSAPRIAIIIDDIGDRVAEGKRAVSLPGPVAMAFLPHTPYAAELAREAHRRQKTVMLHLPLQATNGKALGPGGIELDTTEIEFRRILEGNLAAIPHVEGVNNHMGSLLTRHPGHMAWLMRSLREDHELFFVDSYTHKDSVALQLAAENGLRTTRRDVFLDNEPTPDAILAEFERLVEMARKNGHAVGIGHPYPQTMAFLAEHLPELEERYGVTLVPITELLAQPPMKSAVASPAPAHD